MSGQQNLSQFQRYLANNQELIQEKHSEYFGKIEGITLQNVPVSTLIAFIYDIFGIDRYKNEPKTNKKIQDSLTKNIHDFMNNNPTKLQHKFDTVLAVDSMMYCIANNDIFSVQYDLNTHKESPEDVNEPSLNVEVKKDEGSVAVPSQQNQSQVIRSRVKGIKGAGGEDEENQFNSGPQPFNFNKNQELIKKNAKLAFLNFCKNQMEVGGRKTFDQLEQQASTMTIGKLLVYAKTYCIYNTQITKQFLMRKFKKLAQGRRAIDFQTYYILLTDLFEIDSTLVQRLELNDENLYKKVKYANYPFHTQDQNPRELVACRNFTHKITSHSGKTQAQLRQDLAVRKHSQRQQLGNLKSLPRHIFKQQVKTRMRQKLLSPKDLSGARARDFSIQLSFIDKIVSPEDSDGKYLGDYQIQHYNRKGDETALSNVALKRKQSIVQNIRKRIQQIQRHQSAVIPHKIHSRRYQPY